MIKTVCVVGQDGLRRNREHAASLRLPRLAAGPERKEPLAVVGGGQSAHLFAGGSVMAINGAHDWLIDRGVVPDFAFMLDPQPHLAELFRPHPGIKYLVATVCDPETFAALDGYDVTVFHAPQGEEVNEPLSIPGGPTAMARSPLMAATLGYRDVTLYGADSCYFGATHIYSNTPDRDPMQVRCDGKVWDTCLGLVAQAEYLAELIPAMGCVPTRLAGEHLAQSMLRTGTWEPMGTI